MMKESSGPKKARNYRECHVLVRILWSREGIDEPHCRLFLPDESLELRIQDSVIGPRAAQCTSEQTYLEGDLGGWKGGYDC